MAKKRLSFKQDTIALVYDFDGTLSPQPMQKYTVLPKIDISPHEFWDEVKRVGFLPRTKRWIDLMSRMGSVIIRGGEEDLEIAIENLTDSGRLIS